MAAEGSLACFGNVGLWTASVVPVLSSWSGLVDEEPGAPTSWMATFRTSSREAAAIVCAPGPTLMTVLLSDPVT